MRISLAIKLLAAFNTEHVQTLARGLPRARPQRSKLNFNSWGRVSNMETFLFWLEPKVFISVMFFLGEVLVYFDFEAYFHSPNAADGLLMRNHLRGFVNWSRAKVGGVAIEYVTETKKISVAVSALTLLCLWWVESPPEIWNRHQTRWNDIYGPASRIPRLRVWTWWK